MKMYIVWALLGLGLVATARAQRKQAPPLPNLPPHPRLLSPGFRWKLALSKMRLSVGTSMRFVQPNAKSSLRQKRSH